MEPATGALSFHRDGPLYLGGLQRDALPALPPVQRPKLAQRRANIRSLCYKVAAMGSRGRKHILERCREAAVWISERTSADLLQAEERILSCRARVVEGSTIQLGESWVEHFVLRRVVPQCREPSLFLESRIPQSLGRLVLIDGK